jgi:Icc protein
MSSPARPTTVEYVSQHPAAKHFLLHFSDTHLLANGGMLYGTADAEGHLQQLLTEFERSGGTPEALIFSGDLADEGEPGAYTRLRAIVEPVADRLGAKLIWAMGNHDNRAAFRAALLDEEPSMAPVDNVIDLDGLRIITLDSTVPGHHFGLVSTGQLRWLEDVLSVPARDGTLLVMHHPPVPSVEVLAVAVELREQHALAAVLRGSDVRSILAGHLHFSTHATFAGIPVSVAAATCYTQDLNVEPGGTRGQDGGQSFNQVHLYDDTVVHSVVPIGRFQTVGKPATAETGRQILKLEHIRIAGA